MATPIPGCWEIHPRLFEDVRGRFVKTFVAPEFAEHQLITEFVEEYYSVSRAGVLRGMHFQTPPHDHAKIVYCSSGSVLDVIVDLRRSSPAFGKSHSVYLDSNNSTMLYIPKGIAHGFLSLNEAVMHYKVSSVYSSAHDMGIAWDSIEFDWPNKNPVVSARDAAHPQLSEFESPFQFRIAGPRQ